MKKYKTLLTVLFLIIFALVLGVYIYGSLLLDNIKYVKLPENDQELGITPAFEQESLIPKTTGSPEASGTPEAAITPNLTSIPNETGTANTTCAPNPTDTPDTTSSPNPPDTTDTPDTTSSPNPTYTPNAVTVTNIVLFGLDRRTPDEACRTDTIIIVSLDKNNKVIKVTSLMRDMYVPIPGKGLNRINAAYTYGGALLAIKTINTNFSLDIREYVAVDFIGLVNIIDKVGGLEINVKDYEIPEIERVSSPGLQTLNGRQVVDYSRIRYVGNADFERTQRQRYVLDLLYKKIKSQGIINLPGTVSALLPYVETSLSKSEITELVIEVAQYNTESLEQLRLPADGSFEDQKIRGMYVLVPDIEENKKMLHQFIYNVED